MLYKLPSDLPANVTQPAQYLQKLLRLPEFSHLKDGEAHIEFLMRGQPEFRGGRHVLGSVHLPQVQGQLKNVFAWILEEKFGSLPDFLVILEEDYWLEADEREREILVYHELCHTTHAEDKNGAPRYDKDTGRPVFALVGHDVEEFAAVVRRYGLHNPDLVAFVKAASEHAEAME